MSFVRKKDSHTYFKSKTGLEKTKKVSTHVSSLSIVEDEDGYEYFSEKPTHHGIKYLYDSTPSMYTARPERQLGSSYIVDEDGGIIKVD